jgi:hypothetical protein
VQAQNERETQGRAAIAGRIVSSLRTLLRERGVWSEVERSLEETEPHAAAAMAAPDLPEWVEIESYLRMLDAAGRLLSEEQLRSLGRQRMERDAQSGFFGGVLRGWIRSIGSDPEDVVRVLPHLWRAGVRGLEDMYLVSEGERCAQFAVANLPPAVLACRPWHAVLAGIAEGVAALVEVPVSVERSTEDGALSFTVRW